MLNKLSLYTIFICSTLLNYTCSEKITSIIPKKNNPSNLINSKFLDVVSKLDCKAITHKEGFYYAILNQGEKTDSLQGKTVSFHYKLETLDQEKICDSFLEGEPLLTEYNNLIPIIQQSLLLAGKNGKSISFVSGDKFFHYKGVGKIPANQDVILTISLIGVQVQ